MDDWYKLNVSMGEKLVVLDVDFPQPMHKRRSVQLKMIRNGNGYWVIVILTFFACFECIQVGK